MNSYARNHAIKFVKEEVPVIFDREDIEKFYNKWINKQE